MIVGATLLIVRNGTGTFAMAASSLKISPSIGVRSWPPNSFGQLSVSQPSLPICATVSRYTLPRPISPSLELSASARSGVISLVK